MSRTTVAEVQAWLEPTKLTITDLEPALMGQIESQILSAIASAYDVSGWTDATTTPELVRSVLAIEYAAMFYNRQYSEDQSDTNDYARFLLGMVRDMIAGIIAGTLDLIDVPGLPTYSGPGFYPTDASSSLEPTDDDQSLGGPVFSLGRRF